MKQTLNLRVKLEKNREIYSVVVEAVIPQVLDKNIFKWDNVPFV